MTAPRPGVKRVSFLLRSGRSNDGTRSSSTLTGGDLALQGLRSTDGRQLQGRSPVLPVPWSLRLRDHHGTRSTSPYLRRRSYRASMGGSVSVRTGAIETTIERVAASCRSRARRVDPAPVVPDGATVRAVVERLYGLPGLLTRATPEQRRRLYTALGVQLHYRPPHPDHRGSSGRLQMVGFMNVSEDLLHRSPQ
jgi:hypothetical protein